MLFVLLLACSPKTPQTVADCDGLYSGKDDCYAKMAPAEFNRDPQAGIDLVEKKIQDPTIRDFVYLTVTREIDPSTSKYCDRMKDEVLANRCKVLVSRPHLHRGLSGKDVAPPGGSGAVPPSGGPPGAPPPGAAPSGPAPGSAPPPPAPGSSPPGPG